MKNRDDPAQNVGNRDGTEVIRDYTGVNQDGTGVIRDFKTELYCTSYVFNVRIGGIHLDPDHRRKETTAQNFIKLKRTMTGNFLKIISIYGMIVRWTLKKNKVINFSIVKSVIVKMEMYLLNALHVGTQGPYMKRNQLTLKRFNVIAPSSFSKYANEFSIETIHMSVPLKL